MPTFPVRDDELPQGVGTGGPEVPIVPAASAILLRGDPFEVLLIRRHDRSAYAPGAWVFPGGLVDPVDRRVAPGDNAERRACAVRETLEEVGVWLGDHPETALAQREAVLREPASFAALWPQARPEELVFCARWITPVGIPRRFDTCFFLAQVSADTAAVPDLREGSEVRWLRPAAALAAHAAGMLRMLYPTVRHLEDLGRFPTAEKLLSRWRGATVEIVRPVLVIEGGRKALILPDPPDLLA